MDTRNLTPGTKYVIWLTGITARSVAECTSKKDSRGFCIVKVLNKGFMQNAELKHGDYGVVEVYDEAKHGPIE
jgi:hypothetical protein